jgi:hypothetical protein
MNEKLLNIINTVVNALDVYLCTVTKAKFEHSLLQSIRKWAVWGVGLIILLLSTWITLLSVLFISLDSIGFTYIQAILAVLGINLVGLLILALWFKCLKKQTVTIRRSGLGVIITYLIKSANNNRNKQKN